MHCAPPIHLDGTEGRWFVSYMYNRTPVHFYTSETVECRGSRTATIRPRNVHVIASNNSRIRRDKADDHQSAMIRYASYQSDGITHQSNKENHVIGNIYMANRGHHRKVKHKKTQQYCHWRKPLINRNERLWWWPTRATNRRGLADTSSFTVTTELERRQPDSNDALPLL